MTTTNFGKFTKALRTGHHSTVYEVKRDPELSNKDRIINKNDTSMGFVKGSSYKGEWRNDMKEGFGVQHYSDGSRYDGEWLSNKRHGKGTFWVKKGKKSSKQYVGDWANGVMEGEGTFYYDNGDIYNGSWVENKRTGQGRLTYQNGDIYQGDWVNDRQEGFGTLRFQNGNVFEGLWVNGMKEGPGRYFYSATKKVYDGEWAEDSPKCGEFREPSPDEQVKFGSSTVRGSEFHLPELTLSDARGVLSEAISQVRITNATRRGLGRGESKDGDDTGNERSLFSEQEVAGARAVFREIETHLRERGGPSFASLAPGSVPLAYSEDIFQELGIDVGSFDLLRIMEQLDLRERGRGTEGDSADITFPELMEVAICLCSD